MTIPTEYEDNLAKIGSDAITHPIYTFRVKLDRPATQKVGPITNSRDVVMLHPDMHDSSPDRGRANAAQHTSQKLAFLPGLLAAGGIIRNDDETFTAYGAQAVHLKKTYVDGPEPLLELVNSPPYTSA